MLAARGFVYGGLLFMMMRFSPGGMAALVTRIFHTARWRKK